MGYTDVGDPRRERLPRADWSGSGSFSGSTIAWVKKPLSIFTGRKPLGIATAECTGLARRVFPLVERNIVISKNPLVFAKGFFLLYCKRNRFVTGRYFYNTKWLDRMLCGNITLVCLNGHYNIATVFCYRMNRNIISAVRSWFIENYNELMRVKINVSRKIFIKEIG